VVAPRTVPRSYDGAAQSLPRPPRSSFGHGAAGVAYLLSRRHALTGDPSALDAAASWATQAEHDMTAAGAFDGPPPVFPDIRGAPPSSVLFGEAGVWWVAAQVHARRGDTDGAERAAGRFSALATSCPAGRLDVAAGAAGLLLATATIVDLDRDRLVPVGDELARRLDRAIEGSGDVAWLGAAHGWAGVAHALLRWCQATGTPPGPALTTLLDALPEARLAAGVWPRRHGSAEVWPGWCHGSAGWAQLWVLAAEVRDDDNLLALAERPAVHAILGRGAGAGLCCGLAGQAFAALALYRATGEPTWLVHGRRLAEETAGTAIGPDFPEHSLWGGDVGVALLCMEVEEPARAVMPLYG
jgi:eukaryotic-like serine/threonine-protein kinase